MSAGQNIPECVDSAITAAAGRFWWPVYAEFRDHGHPPESSLRLCHQVISVDPNQITNGIRNDRCQGRLRAWMEDETRGLLSAQSPSHSGGQTSPVRLEEAEAREPLRLRTHSSPEIQLPAFNQRWALVLLETALDRLLLSSSDPINDLELDGLLEYLDRPLPANPIDDFPGWIRTPQILSLKGRFWRELRRAVNETITDPRLLETELLDLFPPR